MTDGCASQISSGAAAPGQYNTTIGTTMVVKGVSEQLLLDPAGRIYCHRHPQGWWLPGGASNTGAECLAVEFGPDETERRSARALQHSPTRVVCYPLLGRGERFPFMRPEAAGFVLGTPRDRDELFCAYLEGVACLERLAFETLEGLGARVGDTIYSAGGGHGITPYLLDHWVDIFDKTGVDIYFPLVLRAAGPLDRIVQTAGRCNREGKLACGKVIIFFPKSGGMPKGEYRSGFDAARSILKRGMDLHDPSTYRVYFEQFYQSVEQDKRINQERAELNFRTVAATFKMIKDNTHSVLVNYRGRSGSNDIVQRFLDMLNKGVEPSPFSLRGLQPYIVGVYERDIETARRRGLVRELMPGFWLWEGRYDERKGIADISRDPADLVL